MLTIRQLDKPDIRQLDESSGSTGPMVRIRHPSVLLLMNRQQQLFPDNLQLTNVDPEQLGQQLTGTQSFFFLPCSIPASRPVLALLRLRPADPRGPLSVAPLFKKKKRASDVTVQVNACGSPNLKPNLMKRCTK